MIEKSNKMSQEYKQLKKQQIEGELTMKTVEIGEVIDFCCHTILRKETSLDKLCEHFTQLGHYLSLLGNKEEYIYANSRLLSRLSLVALIYDVLSITCRRWQHQQHQEKAEEKIEKEIAKKVGQGKKKREIPLSLSALSDDDTSYIGGADLAKDDDYRAKQSGNDCINFFSVHWKHEDWKRLEEQLVLTKSILLYENTNQYTLPFKIKSKLERESVGDKNHVGRMELAAVMKSACDSSSPMLKIERPPSLQQENNLHSLEKDFSEVLSLLKAEAEIAKFLQRLQDLKQQQQQQHHHHQQHQHERKEGDETMGKNKPSSPSFLKQLESAVNEYASGLDDIFHVDTFVRSKDWDNEGCSDIDDDSDNNDDDNGGSEDSDDRNIEKNDGYKRVIDGTGQTVFSMSNSLISSLLQKLYQKGTDSLLDRLLKYLRNQVLYNPQCEFSYEQVHRKYRALLIRWSNIVLDTPIILGQKKEYTSAEEGTDREEELPSALQEIDCLRSRKRQRRA